MQSATAAAVAAAADTDAAAAAAAALSVAILLLLLQQQCCCFLLMFVIVCRMVKFVAGSLNMIPVFYFSSFKRDLCLMVHPLAVLCRIYCLQFFSRHPR